MIILSNSGYEKKNIGKQIRQIRRSQKMTMNDLAKQIGVSKSLISQVELGTVYPSLQTLEKLSSALNTSLSSLFQIIDLPQAEIPNNIVRHDKHKIILMPETNNRYHILTPSVLDNPFEFLMIEFPPHDAKATLDYSVHSGAQCFYVLIGELVVNINNIEYTVSTGDSGFIPPNFKHFFKNLSNTTAKAIIVTIDSIL